MVERQLQSGQAKDSQKMHETSHEDRSRYAKLALVLVLSIAAGCVTPERRRMGETFDIDSASYTIKYKRVRGQISLGGSTMDAGRHASFVLIGYLVVNHGKDSMSVNPLALRLVTADQTEYDVDLPATYALRMGAMFDGTGEDSSSLLSGGGSGSYVVVFRVPDDVAHQKFNIIIRRRVIIEVD